jgi:hypothetical protein
MRNTILKRFDFFVNKFYVLLFENYFFWSDKYIQMMIFRFQRLIFAYPQVSYCEFERKKLQVAFFFKQKIVELSNG